MTCSQFSWCRLWCVLRHATIKCWDCKEDSNHRDPVECIEIKPVRCGIATYTYFSKRFCTSHQWLYLSSPRLILVDVGYQIPSGVLRQDISRLLIEIKASSAFCLVLKMLIKKLNLFLWYGVEETVWSFKNVKHVRRRQLASYFLLIVRFHTINLRD